MYVHVPVASVQDPSPILYSTQEILVRLSVAVPVNVGVVSLVGFGDNGVRVTTGFVMSTVNVVIVSSSDSLPASSVNVAVN